MPDLGLMNIRETDDGRYRVHVKSRGRNRGDNTGTFDTLEEAMRVRAVWRRELGLPRADDAYYWLKSPKRWMFGR